MKRAFTLTELLAVIGIIVLLIGLLLPALARVYANSNAGRVRMDLTAIVAALDAYQHDYRAFPPATADGSTDLLPLLTRPLTRRGGGFYGPYLSPERLHVANGQILDVAMNLPIQYAPAPDLQSYTLRAAGFDGVYGTADDWTAPKE